jgi:hypothetical protein
MLRDAAADYAALDAACDGWSETETEIGLFDVLPHDSPRELP